MVTAAVEVRPVVAAVAALLRARTGRPVGEGEAPKAPVGTDTPVPYYVVESIAGTGGYGGLSGDDMLTVVIQVTAAGFDLEGALGMSDRARREVLDLGNVLGGPGWAVRGRRHQSFAGADTSGTVASSADRYELEVQAWL